MSFSVQYLLSRACSRVVIFLSLSFLVFNSPQPLLLDEYVPVMNECALTHQERETWPSTISTEEFQLKLPYTTCNFTTL